MRHFWFTTVFCFVLSYPGFCQITVAPGDSTVLTIDSLVRRLVGPGVLISNIQSNHSNGSQSIGYMLNPTLVFGMQKGMVMSTGRAVSLSQPNSSNFLHFNSTGFGSDPQLSSLLPNTNFVDICSISFDFIPLSDTIRFNYVFGSEEYSYYSCPGVVNFNDVFGFFVNGPRPQGGTYQNQNFARLPFTSTNTDIVSINNVTDGGCAQSCAANTVFFRSNFFTCASPSGTFPTAYDGFTVKLNVTIPVIPCATYSIKLIIADVRDALFDSFVLLEEGFVQSPRQITLTAQPTYSRFNDMLEGCHDVRLIAHKLPVDSFAVSVPFKLTGTATPGVDYLVNGQSANIGLLTFAPFADTASLVLTALADSVTDDNESVKINLYNTCEDTATQPPRGDSAVVFIREKFAINAGPDTFRCGTPPVQLQPVGLFPGDQLLWSPTGSLSCTTCPNPLASPAIPTTYTLTVTDSITRCVGQGQVTVFADEPITISDTSICKDRMVKLLAGTGGGTFQYQWKAHATLRPPLNQSAVELIPDDSSRFYFVTIAYPSGCVRLDSVFVEVLPSPRYRPLDTVLCSDKPVRIDLFPLTPDSATWSALQSMVELQPNPWRAIIPASPAVYTLRGTLQRGPCESSVLALINMLKVPSVDLLFRIQRPDSDVLEAITFEELTNMLPPFFLYAEPVDISQNIRYQWTLLSITTGVPLVLQEGNVFGPYLLTSGGSYGLSAVARYVSQPTLCEDSIFKMFSLANPVIPNVVTPNDDGLNDWFHLKHLSPLHPIHVVIIDRWGRIVMKQNDY